MWTNVGNFHVGDEFAGVGYSGSFPGAVGDCFLMQQHFNSVPRWECTQ